MGMLWRQQPSHPNTRHFSSPPASPGFPSHLLLQVTPNHRCRLQTFSLPVSSSPSPVHSPLSDSVSPLSLQPQLPFQPVPSLPPSSTQARRVSTLTEAIYTRNTSHSPCLGLAPFRTGLQPDS